MWIATIKLKINGKLEWFLLDTGANANYLKQSYFDAIELKPKMIGLTKSNDSNRLYTYHNKAYLEKGV